MTKKMRDRILNVLTVFLALSINNLALAQEPKGVQHPRLEGSEGTRPEVPSGLKVTSSAKRQVEAVNEKGEKVDLLEDVAAAVPGDELVMLITYVNQGREPAKNVSLVNPIPGKMSYVGDSARGEGTVVTFSVDGGKTYGPPESLFVVQADGTRRMAEPGEYTHIRWLREGPLAADGRGEARFRVIIK